MQCFLGRHVAGVTPCQYTILLLGHLRILDASLMQANASEKEMMQEFEALEACLREDVEANRNFCRAKGMIDEWINEIKVVGRYTGHEAKD